VAAVTAAAFARALGRLDAYAFADREAAARELAALGPGAESHAQRALAASPSPEVRRRLQSALSGWRSSPDRLRERRALAALEYAGTPEARRHLTALSAGADASLTREAKAALGRLAGVTSPPGTHP
jgi:hypothetical protein